MSSRLRLAAVGVAVALLCSCSEFEPVEPYLRVISADPSPWHAELDKQTGNLLFLEVAFTIGNWSKENCYLTSYEIRYFDVETYGRGDLSPGNTLSLVEGDTLWVWTNAYSDPQYFEITDDPGPATYPPGPVVRYGGTRIWLPGVEEADFGNDYTEQECNVMVSDGVLRACSEYWLVKNRSQAWGMMLWPPPEEYQFSHDDIGIVAVVKLRGETEGGDEIEVEAHVDVGTYVVVR
jgi:hypothetical protein